MAEDDLHVIRIFPGQLVPATQSIAISIKLTCTAKEVISLACKKLNINQDCDSCELVEVCYRDSILVHQSEHVLKENDLPAAIQLSWNNLRPRQKRAYRFFLRVKPKSDLDGPLRYQWMDCHEGINDTITELNFDLDFKMPDDDLCRLPILDEETLLEHLKERFKQGKIYTYVGEILIAVNPFRFFPIYNPKFINAYNNRNLGSLPPHIFAIADVAYHRMLREKKSQCVVISGESGSGKTESTKLLVHHLTALSHKTQASAVEKTILGVGPVLEAFGNAKTAYNNNSSRFGKFTQIKFREDGTVSGAALRKYLLEKSRIVSQAPEERNYHVFYYLLAGATPSDREELHLLKPEEYFYLNQSECYTIDEGTDEAYEFLRLKQSMDMVGFTPDIQRRIFRVLSAVLHIGNLELARKPGQEDSAVIVKDNQHLDIVCNMLMVTRENLMSVLTTRKNKTRGEEFIVTYKYEEALATRDAMAKALYGTLFDWIVLQVNHVLLLKQQSTKEFSSIGVLDIFGFEDFAHNSYEQFCINFANEKLQKYFNHHIFKLEQDEYFAEGIEWRNVHFVDNSECLELIAGKPTGLLNLIDEESNFPGATESSLLAKVNKTHSRHKFYESFLMEDAFIVKHYAGSVKYDIKGFLDKNRDLMRPDILRALKNSSLRFVRELLGADPVAVYRWAIVRTFFKAVHAFKVSGKLYRHERACDASIKARRRLSKHLRKTMMSIEEEAESASLFRKASRVIRRMQKEKNGQKPIQPLSKFRHDLETKRDMAGKSFDYLYRTGGPRGKAAPKNPPTVSAQFQSSLNRLMEILSEAQPFFVRCVRSNAEKAPLMFDQEVVLRQLRYTGMLETVRIRKLGYPWRFPFELTELRMIWERIEAEALKK